ncbi:MAG: hypothetical protein R2879_15355 [Saprospiraceae bacterium]
MSDLILPGGDLLNVAILVDGSPIPDEVQILSVFTEAGFNQMPMLSLVLTGRHDEESLEEWLDKVNFKDESIIEVKAGYEYDLKTIFKGEFLGLNISYDGEKGSKVQVDAISRAYHLDVVFKSFSFSNISDKDLMDTIANEEQIIIQNEFADLNPTNLEFEGTAWELILDRALAKRLVAIVDFDKIILEKPSREKDAIGILDPFQNIIDMELTLESNYGEGREKFGEITIQGTNALALNQIVEIRGINKLFNGNALIIQITHDLAEGNWETVLGLEMG